MTGRIAYLIAAVLVPADSYAGPADHADYVVIGKSINHRQLDDGSLRLLNTVFFAEVFKTADGTVSSAVLTGPGEANSGLPFSGDGIHFLAGKRQSTIEGLSELYPGGTYFFSFDTPDGPVRELPATFERREGELRNPGPIRISLRQHGRPVEPTAIDPDADLTVRWSAFRKGSADPNGIIDDMIYIIFGDCMGNETGHSGHAISNPDALTFRASEYVIDAELLAPGQPFQLEVEHSNMDTAIEQGIEVIVTYAATSFLDIHTTGEADAASECPDIPWAMDGGQTDRRRPH